MNKKRKSIFLVIGVCILFSLNSCVKKGNMTSTEKEGLTSVKEATASVISIADVKKDFIIHVPTQAEVEKKREEVLAGMKEEEIERLKETIKVENLALEHSFMWDNLEKNLSDPENLMWNLIDTTGFIQIGWGYDTEVYEEKKTDDMTMDEFLEQYGIPVMTDNDKDAETFCRQMEELRSTIVNKALRKDFDHLISNMRSARETHDVTYIRNIYEILHDMDYYLLRYGPTEMGAYVSDMSLVCTYYGVLEVYEE
ncbi:MAG TPA: hypothetical protein H9717_06155 [Candidatus Eisenbergiella merdipullorum]|uniref:Uncharacterized protein n=1 Tax=Candidatus Eisenbergiella merdipullorum TaxID=2838553 RepID=A0A9D2KZU1_9FIRM|nr:hypothetical protein [Candidatus Eisenbergiella merdipullorum]